MRILKFSVVLIAVFFSGLAWATLPISVTDRENKKFVEDGAGNVAVRATLAAGSVLSNTGNVGIGTSDVTHNQLTVNGGVTISTASPAGYVVTTAPAGGLLVQGNVGIGSPSPVSKLDVTGTVTATAFSGDGSALTNVPSTSEWTRNAPYIFPTTLTDNVGIGTRTPGSSFTILKNSTNDYMHINSTATAGGNVFIVNNAGNIGIGTAKPTAALDIMGVNNTGSFVIHQAASANFEGLGLNSQGPANNGLSYINGSGVKGATFWDNASLSIGASSSYYNADGNANGLLVQGNIGIGTWKPAFPLDVQVGGSNSFQVDTGADINFNSGSTANLTSAGGFNLITSSNGTIQFSPNGSGNVNTAGNVGIGTTDTTKGQLIVMGGNVGIGTVNPIQKFQVGTPSIASITAAGQIQGTSFYAGNCTFGAKCFDDNNSTYIQNAASGTTPPAIFGSYNSHHLELLAGSGFVGIGTASPGQALDVTGSIRTSTVSGQSDGTLLCIKSGRIGYCSGVVTGIACTCN